MSPFALTQARAFRLGPSGVRNKRVATYCLTHRMARRATHLRRSRIYMANPKELPVGAAGFLVPTNMVLVSKEQVRAAWLFMETTR